MDTDFGSAIVARDADFVTLTMESVLELLAIWTLGMLACVAASIMNAILVTRSNNKVVRLLREEIKSLRASRHESSNKITELLAWKALVQSGLDRLIRERVQEGRAL